MWGRERPLTLVWLALQDGTGRNIASADTPGPAAEALRDLARARGLPTVLPLLDLEDRGQVRFTDIWGGFHESVVAASRRYGAEAVLIGRLERVSGDHWRARWTLVLPDRQQQWQGGGERLTAALSSGVDELAQILAERFAIHADGQAGQRLLLSIADVTTLEDYARVAGYLRSRDFIRNARLREAAPDTLRFELEVQGDVQSLRRLLSLADNLVPVPPDAAAMVDEPGVTELRYRLLP